MELKTLILEYKEKQAITNDELARRLGVDKSTVSRWLSGDVRRLQQETKSRLSRLLGMDVEPLIEGNVLQIRKPILGIAKAGYDLFAQENYLGEEEVTLEESRKGDFFLEITGNSMENARIHEGDLVYVRKTNQVESGTIAVLLLHHEEVTVKRYVRKDNLIILEAANPEVENRYFTLEEAENLPLEIIGQVVYAKTWF